MTDDVEMAVSKPLDELIADERKKRRAQRGKGRGGRGGARGSNRGARGASKSGRGRKENFSDRSIQKKRGDRTNRKWAHDKFEQSNASNGNSRKSNRRSPTSNKPMSISTGTKVLVSHLHLTISADDLREIFQQVGPVKKVEVQYDQNGTSLGSATVIFSRKGDAVKACRGYDDAMVDGKPMTLQLVSSVADESQQAKTGSPRSRNSGNSRGRGGGKGRGRGRGGRRGGGGRSSRGGRSGGGGGGAFDTNPLLRLDDDDDTRMDTTTSQQGKKGKKNSRRGAGGGSNKGKGGLFGSALRDATSGRRNNKGSGKSEEQRKQELDADMMNYHQTDE